jgi:hypothetical protein
MKIQEQYYLFLDGERKGPFGIGQLTAMWLSGAVNAETMYWRGDTSEWRSITELNALLSPKIKTSPPSPSKKSASFFIHRDGQEHGPYTQDQLQGFLKDGSIVAEDYCRADTDGEWSTVATRLATIIPTIAGNIPTPPIRQPKSSPQLSSPPVSLPPVSTGQATDLIDLVGLPAYYQEEFQKIHASRETYQGKWNWAAFCFGSLWALAKGLWLSLLVSVIAGVAIGSVTCGVGAGPVLVIYWFVYGFRGNYMYYCSYVKRRQLPF